VSSSSQTWQRLAQRLHKEERDRHHSRVRRRSRRAVTIAAVVVLLCVTFLYVVAHLS
jgi:uncharacterized membrane protein